MPTHDSNNRTDKDEEQRELAKANSAIAIRPKRGRLTLLSRRIYNALLYQAQQQGVERPTYTVSLAELVDDAYFTSHNTELLKAHIRDMQATTIEWYSGKEGRDRQWTSTQLIGTVQITERGRGSPCTISWTYPNEIKEKLVVPTQYTKMLLEVSAAMRSYAAAVLYELGARYLTSPGRLTMREDLIWWAAVLTGRSDITSVDYRIFHRDVIKKALAEVEALSPDFKLEAITHKRGRKVEELQFRVLPKAQQPLEMQAGRNTFDLAMVDRIESLGFKRAEAEDLYATHDEGLLRATLSLVEGRLKAQDQPALKAPAAYFRDALKKGYAAPSVEPARSEPAKASHGLQPHSLEERKEQLRQQWRHRQADRAKVAFESMTEGDQRARTAAFEREALPSLAAPIGRAWRKDGARSRLVHSAFFGWLATSLWGSEVTDDQLLELALANT